MPGLKRLCFTVCMWLITVCTRNSKHTYSKSHDASGQKTGVARWLRCVTHPAYPFWFCLMWHPSSPAGYTNCWDTILKACVGDAVLCYQTKSTVRFLSLGTLRILLVSFRYQFDNVSLCGEQRLTQTDTVCANKARVRVHCQTAWTGLSVSGKLMKVPFSWKHQSESALKCFVL